MKKTLIGAGIILAGGLVYGKINDELIKREIKRRDELVKIESEWHNAGFTAGHKDGYMDGYMDGKRKLQHRYRLSEG